MAKYGVQRPTFERVPASAENYWKDVRDLCASVDLELDPWQEHVVKGSLGEDRDGKWSATRVGLSVPRQNGKTALLEARELAGLLLYEEELIIHSAHLVQTALEGFHRIRGYFENYDDLRKRVRKIREGSGEQAVEMMSGQRLKFQARSGKTGRGFSCDCLILDEAQELEDKTWAAILPTVSARPNPQIWLAGTPPSPDMKGDVFTRARKTAIAGSDKRAAWFEWACGDSPNVDDPSEWARANPGLGIRITQSAIQDERHSMDEETFARERLGMWESEQKLAVIDPVLWASGVTTAMPPSDAPRVFAVDMTPDGNTASICVAVEHEGLRYIDIAMRGDTEQGAAWVVEWLSDRTRRKVPVVVDQYSPARLLMGPLQQARVNVITTNGPQLTEACGLLLDSLKASTLRHYDAAPLNDAVASARKETYRDGSGWKWKRDGEHGVSPLIGSTLALWGLTNKKLRNRGSGRVVMA